MQKEKEENVALRTRIPTYFVCTEYVGYDIRSRNTPIPDFLRD